MGVPLLWFADNEAHSNGRYGLRIFTHAGAAGNNGFARGVGNGAGYYPKVDPCSDVSATNPFVTASFYRQYSWRNGKNGVTIGSVAAINLVDAVVADNNERGIEMVGADGITTSMSSDSKLRGPWGANLLIRPLFVGHMLPCPGGDATIQVKHAYESLGETVVYDNGVDCWNGCQVFHDGYPYP